MSVSVPYMIAAALAFGVGTAHSLLGEKYIVSRLMRLEHLPHLAGSDDLTRRIIAFAWHLTSIAWWGFGAILVALAVDGNLTSSVSGVITVVFMASAVLTAVGSRLQHPAWIVFLAISVLSLIG
jgi:hypothetical protein